MVSVGVGVTGGGEDEGDAAAAAEDRGDGGRKDGAEGEAEEG